MMPRMLAAERKRKRPLATLAEDIDTEAQAHAFLAKRRRQQPIETGLAALSLSLSGSAALPPPAPAIHLPPSPLQYTPAQASSGAFSSVHLPSPVTSVPTFDPASAPVCVDDDEPTSPEIQMKSSSWYEPEKDREFRIHSVIRLSVCTQGFAYCRHRGHGPGFALRLWRRRGPVILDTSILIRLQCRCYSAHHPSRSPRGPQELLDNPHRATQRSRRFCGEGTGPVQAPCMAVVVNFNFDFDLGRATTGTREARDRDYPYADSNPRGRRAHGRRPIIPFAPMNRSIFSERVAALKEGTNEIKDQEIVST